MNITRFTFCTLMMAFLLTAGCVARVGRSPLNPAEGWKFCWSQDPKKLGEAIVADYQDYIQKLPPEERNYVGTIHTFEDGTGQHAVNIEIGINGTWWQHVLIYDKENKRIRVVKYTSGGYRS